MNGQKGITLVALVITIIIMLILAAVTISIVMNGGLFTQANNAAEQTNNSVVDDAIAAAIARAAGEHYSGTPVDQARFNAILKAEGGANISDVSGTSGVTTVKAAKTGHTKTIDFDDTSGLKIEPAIGEGPNKDLVHGWKK
jgi:type II secretory pathway pseudopilin PulG